MFDQDGFSAFIAPDMFQLGKQIGIEQNGVSGTSLILGSYNTNPLMAMKIIMPYDLVDDDRSYERLVRQKYDRGIGTPLYRLQAGLKRRSHARLIIFVLDAFDVRAVRDMPKQLLHAAASDYHYGLQTGLDSRIHTVTKKRLPQKKAAAIWAVPFALTSPPLK